MTTATQIDAISPADVQQQANHAKEQALTFVIENKVAVVDLDTCARAGQVRAAIGERQKAITAALSKPKSWAHGLHKWFCALEAAALTPYDMLDAYERDQIRNFNEAERQRREARERSLAEARRQADEARALEEAAALELLNEHEMAAAVIAEATSAPPPMVVLPDAVKASGQKFRRVYKWRVDHDELVPREFLMIDEVKLNRYAAAMKDSAHVPGITFTFVDEPIR